MKKTITFISRRAAVLLLVMMLTATTAAWATTTSTINVGGTDYTLFTGFTATDGNGTNYAKLVDGNTSTDWVATKNYVDPNAPAGDFNGGTEDPAFVEFHADEAFIPKGYVLTCYHENAGYWKPVEWALKAKLNEGDAWTTIHSSNTTLGVGKTFEIACDNDGDNQYQYFRFEVYEVGTTRTVDLDELQFYGSLPAYTHLTVKAATCMATGIKVDCYRRNSDGKYFTDNTGETELAESDVIAPIIPHTGEHHEATDVNIEYWQCSMCGKYFSDSGYTTEITEEQTKIYRTITIDSSISGLVTVAFSKTQALAGESIILYVDYQVDASTLKVNDGAVELTAKTDIQYTFTMPAADVTVTADVAQSNADGDVLTGSIRHTVTILDGASITLNDAAISGSIVCEGSATITLVGTNSVSGATNTAGIQIGGSGTTLTIRGDGSLTANGGAQSAGIGLSRAWNVTEDVVGGNIVINGGNITANGGGGGAGIGAGVTKDPNNSSSRKAIVGTITIAGGSVTAVGGSNADGIGAGENNYNATIQIGTVTIYDGIDKVDASSIKNFGSVVYMHGETNVTANKTDYFAIGEDGNRRLIVQKPVIADIPDQTYTGSEITPEPLVMAGSLNLTKGTDYEYSYTNNTNVGTAKVRATFQGTYASLGHVEKEFKIVKSMTNNDISITIPSQTWNGYELTPVITVKDGETVLTENTDYTVTPPSGPIQDSGNHAYTITGMGNYSGSRVAMFTITPYLADQAGAVYVYQDQNGKTALLDGTSVDPVDIDFNHNINVNHVTNNRVFTPGKASTVMLPFNYTCNGEEGGTFYKFVGVEKENDKWVATMQETGNDANKEGTLEANTPYLFMPAATTMTFPNINGSVRLFTRDGGSGGNCETADPGSHWTFKGTYQYMHWKNDPEDLYYYYRSQEIGHIYGFAGVSKNDINVGDFVKVAWGAKIRPMRAYLLWNNEPNSANARSFTRGAAATDEELPQSITVRLVGSNGETTGIGTLDTETGEMTFDSEAWYTLDGVRLSGKPTKKGLYINNGKKIVIK